MCSLGSGMGDGVSSANPRQGTGTIRTNWTETWDFYGRILVKAQLPYVMLNYSLV